MFSTKMKNSIDSKPEEKSTFLYFALMVSSMVCGVFCVRWIFTVGPGGTTEVDGCD